MSRQQSALHPWGSSEDLVRFSSEPGPAQGLALCLGPLLVFGWNTIDCSHVCGLAQCMKQPTFIISTRKTLSFFPRCTCSRLVRRLAREGPLEDDNNSPRFLSASATPGAILKASMSGPIHPAQQPSDVGVMFSS